MAFVADMSVTAAWFLPSQATGYTERMMDRATKESVHLPAIWVYEFANVLVTLERRKKLTAAQTGGALERMAAFRMVVEPALPDAGQLAVLARQHGLSAYDTGYLELALRKRMPLASRDGGLAKAAAALGLFAK